VTERRWSGRAPVIFVEKRAMRLGIISLWGHDLQEFRAQIRLAEELKYGVLGVGDVPNAWHELYVSLTIAALETAQITLAPMVTTPFGRDPAITAIAMSSLHELTGGRVALGIGTGASMARGFGRSPATQNEMREYLLALRELFSGKSISWDGKVIEAIACARPVPIYLSATGPKALALAGELADGVVMTVGSSLDNLSKKIAVVRDAAAAAGRDPAAVDFWAYSFCSIRETRQAALSDISSFLASTAAHQLKNKVFFDQVPQALKDKVLELERRYDVSQHSVPGSANGRLVEELGLVDYLAGLNSIAGTPEEVGAIMNGIASRGVSCLMCALPGISDRIGTMRRFSAAAGAIAGG
jgi:5,10-methylenetetrahydromethanopterin reductase